MPRSVALRPQLCQHPCTSCQVQRLVSRIWHDVILSPPTTGNLRTTTGNLQIGTRARWTASKTAQTQGGPAPCDYQLSVPFKATQPGLHVVIEEEFVGMRAQAQGVMLLAFVGDPHFQKVRREHVPFQ